ncbi:hypothetical protein BJY01DRAFT_263519 [Aspergillus pseudoustus]|uniref:Uncharacterized protein n=1 Tax=Aspergillus pseudoustus TaxID=1810923 RepID=A0ABR4KW11_9EURO
MPILFNPPSRRLFESTDCPAECIIPTADRDAYPMNPKFRWVYNKLMVAELQGIDCGPHWTQPDNAIFPIFSKPIFNLGSMGAEARAIATMDDYWCSVTPGHMWSALLVGEHYSTDIAVLAGKPVWFSHARGTPGPQQTFDYWEVNVSVDPSVQAYIATFVKTHLAEYTGMLNMETIGGKIIEIHLRFSPQWPDLYGSWFLPSIVDLYSGKRWTGPSNMEIYQTKKTRVGYSVVLFDEEKYASVGATLPDSALRQLETMFSVESITLWYNPKMPLETYPRPPGGFRVAWINGFDLAQCELAREVLRNYLHLLFEKKDVSLDQAVCN